MLLLVVIGGVAFAWRATQVHISLAKDNPGTSFPAAKAGAQPLRFAVEGGGSVSASLSGVVLAEVTRAGAVVQVTLPNGLPEGGYELQIAVDRPFPFGRQVGRWAVTIDNQPPALGLDAEPVPSRLDETVVLRAHTEAEARLRVIDASATAHVIERDDQGGVTITFARPPAASVELVATDAAGNETTLPVTIAVAYPTRTRAAHITAAGWGAPEVREPFLALIDRGAIDTVELDLKDEEGVVGFDSKVALANDVGALRPSYRLADAVALLHGKGVRVIGRVVAFRDPLLTAWAWQNGHRDWVVQDTEGRPFSAYGGFANYVQQPVRDYNLAIAEEAGRAGVDDILWDYVRRPEGDPTEMVVPGLTGTPLTTGDAIVEFLGQGQARLRPLGVYQGASVFGIAATRPENIGQPVDRIATVVDYVAPMVYPSHYVDGECGVRSPKVQPHDIVSCSLRDFERVMAGSHAALVPWLQDFSLDGVRYGRAEVEAQISAASEVGAAGYLLWNPAAVYSV